MKSVLKFVVMSLLVVMMSNASYADAPTVDDSKTKATLKARNMVASASPEDWQTLSKAAETCLEKETNLEEAALWLDQALAVKQDAHALALRGDYYALTHKPTQALEYYIHSIETQVAEGKYDVTAVQNKIKALDVELKIVNDIEAIKAKLATGDFNAVELQKEIAALRTQLKK